MYSYHSTTVFVLTEVWKGPLGHFFQKQKKQLHDIRTKLCITVGSRGVFIEKKKNLICIFSINTGLWSWRPGETFRIFYFRERWYNILPRNIKTEILWKGYN